ncbi:MAG: molybdopterin-dependent oxidoreductase [Beijerinckiaceae bacterium]|nr:molybdopterin-dependent oxidoreductase [Beijerinckiaceae bacterium]
MDRRIGNSARIEASRRAFVVGGLAGAFSLGFSLPAPEAALAQTASAPPEIGAWVVVQPDETVIIRVARAEMGQGTLTGLAQLVAEELECDWGNVRYEMVKPAENRARGRIWRDMSTGGSFGIRSSHAYVRAGGAAARLMLIQAAAESWKVNAGECRVERGVIHHPPTGRKATYGSVAAAAAKLSPPQNIALKDPNRWTIAGQPVKRLDTADKLDGSLVYGVDFKLPGMLIALPRACPVHGGKLVSFDAAAISGMRGVKHVLRVDDETVVVVADTFWRAKTALDALPIVWDEGPNANASSETIATTLREGLSAETRFIGNKVGDAQPALASGSDVYEADYSYPYQNHAQMEVLSATVRWSPERCDVWAPTQVAEAAHDTAASAAGVPTANCEIHTMRIGGSFGRRLSTDYIRMAVLIARQIPGVPVKMIWTREEDMAQGRFHPVTRARMRAKLGTDGTVEALHMRISGQSIAAYARPSAITENGDPFVFQGLTPVAPEGSFAYAIPNLLIDHAMRNPHIRPGFWRGVNTNHNAFYSECFIDELAHRAKQDPLDFRRRMMGGSPKHLAVLDAVADRVGWGNPAPDGIFRGIAQYMGFGSYTAAVAEVSVADGRLKMHRIVAATDPGHALNPQQIEAQVAGSFVYGLSAMLHGECTVKDGRIEQQNFDTYNVLRMDEMPAVEVIVMPSGGFWGGVGEPTIAVAAPAVLNAIFAATGKRIRDLPLKNTDLRVS